MTQWETAFATPWFAIEQQPIRDSAGKIGEAPFYRFKVPQGAAILPLTPDGRILIVRQYRQAVGRETIEFPAGAIEPGETPVEAMVRELHEETGYRCASIDLAMEGVVRLERENAQNYFFIGQGAERDPAFRAREQISTELITLASFKRLVIDGRFDHLVALPLFMFAAWKLGLDI